MIRSDYESILAHASEIHLSRPEDKCIIDSQKFDHQVAGHFNEIILQLSSTKILKPIIKQNLFLRELQIYEKSQQLKHPEKKLALAAFMCQYFGVYVDRNVDIEINGLYLILENLTLGYLKPCICDIKMGVQTYEPTVDPEKMRRRIAKFRYQENFGFCISGLKVYDVTTQTYRSYDKSFGRSATPVTVKDMVLSIFYNGHCYRLDAIISILNQLKSLHEYMSHQTEFKFYSSSLLLVYEGDTSTSLYSSSPLDTDLQIRSHQQQSSSSRSTICKMIDFAHTLETSENDSDPLDKGYLKGLDTLIKIFEDYIITATTSSASV